MRSNVILALLFSLFGLYSVAGQAAGTEVQVSDAIARAMPAVAPTSAVFLTLHNPSDHDRALVGAKSSAARAVELHNHTMKDGMMVMRQVHEVRIPAGQTVSFHPGGLHIMLIGLNHALEDGQHIDLTLEFADGQTQTLKVPVGQPKAGGMNHMQHMDHMGGAAGDMQHMQH